MNPFMKEALNEAYQGIEDGHGGPFGAVIVKDGEIVGRGHNSVLKNQDPTCHGEVMAIHDACKRLKTFNLKGCDIYTTGYPCPMCMGAILWANIDRIYFGCNVTDTEIIGFRDKKFYEDQRKGLEEKTVEMPEPKKPSILDKWKKWLRDNMEMYNE